MSPIRLMSSSRAQVTQSMLTGLEPGQAMHCSLLCLEIAFFKLHSSELP